MTVSVKLIAAGSPKWVVVHDIAQFLDPVEKYDGDLAGSGEVSFTIREEGGLGGLLKGRLRLRAARWQSGPRPVDGNGWKETELPILDDGRPLEIDDSFVLREEKPDTKTRS
ncbi:hypothetical protein FHS55_002576 [Angulomicrobium tetraedrale]|uniref:Uncharacterized protein n=1 Tax=Ancylobacter tetraedralis TaxID=217068 RepID=A0A839ZB65_9HYPH|nr:hypothetical protein [Ancylobacter tetraedralis]MBB3771967.1 hypothetical protein [Ancylobacter tetraedralis]